MCFHLIISENTNEKNCRITSEAGIYPEVFHSDNSLSEEHNNNNKSSFLFETDHDENIDMSDSYKVTCSDDILSLMSRVFTDEDHDSVSSFILDTDHEEKEH